MHSIAVHRVEEQHCRQLGSAIEKEAIRVVAVVNPNNWLFLPAYKHLRKRMLRVFTWRAAARLGPGAFEGISGEIVNVALLVISSHRPADDARMSALDATPNTSPGST